MLALKMFALKPLTFAILNKCGRNERHQQHKTFESDKNANVFYQQNRNVMEKKHKITKRQTKKEREGTKIEKKKMKIASK